MSLNCSDASQAAYTKKRIEHWNAVARKLDTWKGWGGYYRRRLTEVYKHLTPAGLKVLEIGCGAGDLLASLHPAVGVGVDFSPEMVQRARTRRPELRFIEGDAHTLALDETFDVVILSDVVNDLWDVQGVFQRIRRCTHPRTRIILNFYSRLWELPLALAQKLHLATPMLQQNWLTVEDIANLLSLTGFEMIRRWQEMICPLPAPLLAGFCNRCLGRLWPFRHLALTNFVVARPLPGDGKADPPRPTQAPTVSVIVAARNEEGNIPQIFTRTPEMGAGTELVFVEGRSDDDTYGAIERGIASHPERRCKLFRQPGEGKGDAVRLGFAKATGDIVIILDADLTVPPEDLPRFVEALCTGRGEFVNGVRLVYPMEERAMRFLNLVGNKFFSMAFSWLLGQPVKDTLCGTKALWKADYELIAANRAYFGDFDPFGDFDLLFGAAKLNLKIVDLPIRYRQRTYGQTNIDRWKHGALLLRMLLVAARRLKFV